MTPVRIGPIALLAVMLTCLPARAERSLSQANWTLSEASQAAAETDLLEMLKPLLELARSEQDQRLLQELKRLAADDSLSLPARERVLFEFTVSLADLDRLAAGADVLGFLAAYQSRVLVPFEDNRRLGIPLYNVRAAAAGVLNEWRRQDGAIEAMTLQHGPGAFWLAAYLSSGPAQRSGYVDSLDFMSEPSLQSLAAQAASRMASEPDLTPVVARIAVLLADIGLLQNLAVHGSGPGLAEAIRAGIAELDEPDRAALMSHAVLHAPAVNAAQAMAELAPGLLHRDETVKLLFDLLGNPDLGAASALALSRSPNPAVRAQLVELASKSRGMESRRAALAAALARDTTGEAGR